MEYSSIEKAFGTRIQKSETSLAAASQVIPVKKQLIVTLNYSWIFTGPASCIVNSPATIYGQVFATAPQGVEAAVITIRASDLFGGTNCLGTYNKAQSATPLGGNPGIYNVRLHALHTTQSVNGEFVASTPSIIIIVDGVSIVNKPYPGEPDPNGTADDNWQFSFGP
jgi:hypothetical protein